MAWNGQFKRSPQSILQKCCNAVFVHLHWENQHMITHDLAWCNDQLQDLLHISLKCFHCLYVSAHVELYCCQIGKLFCTVCSLLFIVANSILSGFFLENPFHNTRVRAKEKVTPDSATLILEVVCQTHFFSRTLHFFTQMHQGRPKNWVIFFS